MFRNLLYRDTSKSSIFQLFGTALHGLRYKIRKSKTRSLPTVRSEVSTNGPLGPTPEEYGLSAEHAARFERRPAYWREDHPLLDLLLLLGAFFCAALVTERRPRLYFWPL